MNKFLDYSMNLMPYVILVLLMVVNWLYFLADRLRIIEVAWFNYLFFMLWSWIIIMIFMTLRECIKQSKDEPTGGNDA